MFNWVSFLTYAVITAATPGPNNILSMTNGSRLGFRKALPFNLGIGVGFSLVMVLCTLFCSLLSAVMPKVKPVLLVVGAAYMLYLAWGVLRAPADLSDRRARDGFVSGLLLQFVNPKIIIYGILSMEAYILPFYSEQPALLFGFALLLAAIGFVFTLCWCAFGSLFKLIFSKYARITNTIMALLLVYCAVSLFL